MNNIPPTKTNASTREPIIKAPTKQPVPQHKQLEPNRSSNWTTWELFKNQSTTATTTAAKLQRKRPCKRERVLEKARTSKHTLKKRLIYRKNRHIHTRKYNTNHDIIFIHYHHHSHSNLDSNNTSNANQTDNGTLDTFLHRIRIEMLNPDKRKQNKQDNLTRKERIALRELTQTTHIVKATIVVEDRDDYICNAMSHLDDSVVYKPMGIRPIVSNCNSISEPISKFVDKWLLPFVKSLHSYLKDSTEF